MTETAHTPLPWVANDKHSGANPWRIETDDGVWANDGWIIAECCGPDAEANARFIVQAVNRHHRLVEALEPAFVTSETEGNLNADKVQYKLVFKFRSLAELDAAHSAWIYRKGDGRCAD